MARLRRRGLSAPILAVCFAISPWVVEVAGAQEIGYGTPLTATPVPHITVAGKAQRIVDPDTCEVRFAVEVRSPELSPARREVAARVNRVIETLRRLHIPDLKLWTTDLSVEPIHARDRRGSELSEVVGYRVWELFTAQLTCSDPTKLADRVGKLIDAATAAGATSVDMVRFSRERDKEKLECDVLAEAVRNAIAKARAIARAAGVKIVGYMVLDGGRSGAARLMGYGGTPSPRGTTIGVLAGRVEISCQVLLVCRIE